MSKLESDDYVNYRIYRAKETLNEIKILIKNKFWNTSVNRMYYASFYAVNALLYKNGILTSSHSGTRQKFGEHFIKTGIIERDFGKLFTELSEKRLKGDYNDFFDFNEETVLQLFPKVEKFIDEIERKIHE